MSDAEFRSKKLVPGATSEPAMQYDGADAPVLVKIPDLNPPQSSSRPPAPQSTGNRKTAPPVANQSSGSSRRSKRRIHRSHQPQGPKTTNTTTASPDARRSTRVLFPIVLVAVVGIGYLFMPDSEEDNLDSLGTDRWAGTPQDSGLTTEADPPNELWPGQQQLAEASEETGAAAATAATASPDPSAPLQGPAASTAESVSTFALPPPLHPSSPAIQGPSQQQAAAEADVSGWPSDPSNLPQPGWPSDSGTESNSHQYVPPSQSPAKNVSYPGNNDGANANDEKRRPLATILGLRAGSSDEQPVAPGRRIATSVPSRNHERLQTSLR